MLTRITTVLRLQRAPRRWLAGFILAGVGITAVVSQTTTPPSIPAITLAAEPLYAKGVRAKPTLTLALSVEFPTVGALYTDQDGYAQTTEYIGYFDPNGCYAYSATNNYFTRTGAATNRGCGGSGFSGNFMNWASSSAIDILRYGMTGGDRWIDTATQTVLQRAVLRNSFYNSANFRSKRLSNTLAADAVPNALKGSHTGTIYVANCLDRIYFGTAETGTCNTPGNNANLGTPSTTGTVSLSSLPAGTSASCAAENGTCTFTGTKAVIYGAASSYYAKVGTATMACNNATFGDPIPGTAKNCYYVDVSSVPGLTTSGVLTYDNHFKSRVEVCDTTGDAISRSSLCTRYPNGNFKPTGNLQKYSDRVRVSVFGYLKDDTLGRHGGVLRAPMKYVGPKTFDNNFNLVSGANPVGEWDENNGVLVANPHGAAEGVSGAINYLNKFGRTGVYGEYKTYDPVGELYYESLRYIQGLAPTPEAVSGITAAMKDGFPVYDTWTDPHPAVTGLTDYSCLKNSIVAIGDVNTHADKFVPGNDRVSSSDIARAANAAANEPDFKFWTKVVGGFEANQSVSYADGQGVSRTTSNPNTPANTARWGMEDQTLGCCNNNSYYISGMAYWANTHDIRASGLSTYGSAKARPGMRVSTYVIDVDEYRQVSNDPNYRLKNQFFLAGKYGGFTDASGTGNPFYAKDGTTVDNSNWLRAGTTNDAKNYFLASNATALLDSINQIFDNILREAGSIAGGAISTQSLTTSGGYIYQAKFDPSDWSGDVARYTLSLTGTTATLGDDDSTSTLRTSTSLDLMTNADVLDNTKRKIIVGKTTATSSATATDFTWAALDSDHQTALRRPINATTSTPDDAVSVGQERLNYIRGDRSLEAPVGNYRKRGSRFGDIVNSGVAYAGAPTLGITDNGYSTFYNANKTRTKALYVGANDGMLHAINADTMAELFAYIPSFVVPNLSAYTSPSYTHRAYVDASPVVGEADLNPGTTGTRIWKTVLVSGAGGGGQGVFALDVTNPTAFDASKVMWEFTDRDDVDMGNVIGKPQILKMRTSAPTATTATYKWFALVASGVNNYVDDGRYSTTGDPVLFLLDLAKTGSQSWVLNSNYYKVTLPLSLTSIAKGAVGFSAVAGPAGEARYIYMGDMQGNMWKLDFGAVGTSGWNMAGVAVHKDTSDNPMPFFVAQTGATTPVRQPITMEPALAAGPNRTTIVAFGTGKFLELTDVTTLNTQTMYAVLDNGSSSVPDRTYLGQATTNTTTATVSSTAFVWGIPTSATDMSRRAGWYFDLPYSTVSGERMIREFLVFGGKFRFSTVDPPTNGCSDGGGRVYALGIAGASGTYVTSTVGVPDSPFMFTIQTGSGGLTVSDTTGARKKTVTFQAGIQGSAGRQLFPVETLDEAVGRLNWRQISNYQDLKRQ